MSGPSTQSARLQGQQLAGGRFHVQGLLGAGGMAEVYRARDTRTNRDVAVKVPKLNLMADPNFVKRFQREINTMKGLKHPHIVEVLFAGRQKDLMFAVFPFMTGGSLKARMHGGQKLTQPPTTPEKMQWLVEIATALDYIHGQKLLHRDVKPDNILFDAQGKAYLSDFGVVRAFQPEEDTDLESLTSTGAVLGTAPYMAPDLILGKKPYTGMVDQYALAVTVYEVLAGNRPFKGQPQTVLILHVQTPPVPLSQKRPDLPRPLTSSVHRGLAKSPEQRFPSCVAFAQSVITSLEQARQAVAARPVTPVPQPFGETAPFPTNGPTVVNPDPASNNPVRVPGPGFPPALPRRNQTKLLWIGLVGLALVLAIVGLVIALSNGSGPAAPEASIVGRWKAANENWLMEFTEHGDWSDVRHNRNLSGTYRIVDSELHIQKPAGLYKYHLELEKDNMTLTLFAVPPLIFFEPDLKKPYNFDRIGD